MKTRGNHCWSALISRPSRRLVSIHGTTREMSSKSMSPRVRSVCTICCVHVVPLLPKGVMITSVGRGSNSATLSLLSSGSPSRANSAPSSSNDVARARGVSVIGMPRLAATASFVMTLVNSSPRTILARQDLCALHQPKDPAAGDRVANHLQR